jgi:hypothetical protein
MGRSITFIGFIKPRRRRPAATKRAFDAMMTMMTMKEIDVAAIKAARRG